MFSKVIRIVLSIFNFINSIVTFDVYYKRGTVKPVNNGHPWDLKKVAVGKRFLIKLRF